MPDGPSLKDLEEELACLKSLLAQKKALVADLREKVKAIEGNIAGATGALAHAQEIAREMEEEARVRAQECAASTTLAERLAYLELLNKEIARYREELAQLEQAAGAKICPAEPTGLQRVPAHPFPSEQPAGESRLRAQTAGHCYIFRLVAFLNARHYLVAGRRKGSLHAHSWQFMAEMEVPHQQDYFLAFRELQEKLNSLLRPYEGTVLNEQEPFNSIPPVTENIGAYFYRLLADELQKEGVKLRRLTVWESPTRGVEVSGKLPGYIRLVENFLTPYEETPVAAAAPAAEAAAAYRIPKGSLEQSEEKKAAPRLADGIKRRALLLALAALCIAATALLAYLKLLSAPPHKMYPWGSDTWGHLFKAEFLYAEIKDGRPFPSFFAWWYNGCPLFRYWAPLPYYALVFFRALSGSIFTAANHFIFTCALAGGLSWLVLTPRMGLLPATFCGIIWSIWPDNARVALSEGNLPRALATALLPLLFAFFLKTVEEGDRRAFLGVALLAQVSVLCHAMIAAVYVFSLSSFALLLFLFGGCTLKGALRGTGALAAGMVTAAWWLLPALKGGLAGMGKEAAAGGVQFIPALVSFNPLVRFTDPEAFYWGPGVLACAAIIICRWRSCRPWVKALGALGVFLVLITFPSFEPVHRLLPFSYLLWPLRFSSVASFALLAGAFALLSRLPWSRVTSAALPLGLFVLLLLDGWLSLRVLAVTRSEPYLIVRAAASLKDTPGWRVATLDLSRFGSAPSYYFTAFSAREQVFGWAWQGAATASNLVLLNTALEHGHYPYLFRSLIYLGATDLLVKEDLIKKPGQFAALARAAGYEEQAYFGGVSHWHGSSAPYLVLKADKGLVVGRHAGTYALLFPELEVGRSRFIDDYKPEELARHPVLILAGAGWHSREKAEKLVTDYARSGGRVVVDLTGFPKEVLAKQPRFLGVWGEEITLYNAMSVLEGGVPRELAPFAAEHRVWKCVVPHGLDEVTLGLEYFGREAALYGFKEVEGARIAFLGANLAYHAYLTGDPEATALLEKIVGMKASFARPEMVALEDYRIKPDGYLLTYSLNEDRRAVLPVAALEGMEARLDGKPLQLESFENLILLDLPAGRHAVELSLKEPPVYMWGKMLAAAGLLLLLLYLFPPRLRRPPVLFAALLLSVFLWPPLSPAEAGRITIDGRFEDWAGQAHLADRRGDGGPGGDLASFYWATNEGESNLYFMVERYPPRGETPFASGAGAEEKQNAQSTPAGKETNLPPAVGGVPATYLIFFDTNNNGSYNDAVDRYARIDYRPKVNFGDVTVRVYRSGGSLIASYGGKWGEGVRQEQKRCEFYVTMAHLGIDPGQCIRMYLNSQAAPPDRCPDAGDIQWAPVPALGSWLAVLFAAGLVLLWLAARGGKNGWHT